MSEDAQALLFALNVAGWETGVVGDRNVVEFWARDRQTGEVLTARGPAIHADQVLRWLAERCRVELGD